jgi:hypothetical protein
MKCKANVRSNVAKIRCKWEWKEKQRIASIFLYNSITCQNLEIQEMPAKGTRAATRSVGCDMSRVKLLPTYVIRQSFKTFL